MEWAGFECGYLGWCDQDLLVETRHTPETDMRQHYLDAMAQGVTTFRDGLPWRHEPLKRTTEVPPGARVIWDLSHFDPPPNPVAHALRCRVALGPNPHVLAVNEPSIWPMLCGRPREEAIDAAIAMMKVFEGDATFYTCDPIHYGHDDEYVATDALVSTGMIKVVGINHYPQWGGTPLAEVLRKTHDRYGLPIAITETGRHEAGPLHPNYEHIGGRLSWLDHVQREIEASGVPVEGVCWYPWLDMPVWGEPGSPERWPCGYPSKEI